MYVFYLFIYISLLHYIYPGTNGKCSKNLLQVLHKGGHFKGQTDGALISIKFCYIKSLKMIEKNKVILELTDIFDTYY